MLQPVLQSPLAPPLQAPIGDFGDFGDLSFVSRFGAGLSAAYFLADLGSKRGMVDGVLNPVVRVRRTNGDLRSFTANDITTGALLAWVGTGGSDNGLIAKWYDGSGNHRDATQDTVADMLKIVDAGVLVTQGGEPSIWFDGDSFISYSGDFQVGTAASVIIVGQTVSTSGILCDSIAGNDYVVSFSQGSTVTAVSGNTGSPTYRVDGADQSFPTRGAAYAAYATGAQNIITVTNVNFNLGGAGSSYDTGIIIWSYYTSQVRQAGKLQGFIVANDSTKAIEMEYALAKEYNITLA